MRGTHAAEQNTVDFTQQSTVCCVKADAQGFISWGDDYKMKDILQSNIFVSPETLQKQWVLEKIQDKAAVAASD